MAHEGRGQSNQMIPISGPLDIPLVITERQAAEWWIALKIHAQSFRAEIRKMVDSVAGDTLTNSLPNFLSPFHDLHKFCTEI